MSRYIDIHTHNFTSRHTELQVAGIHPWDADKTSADELDFSQVQAIGEIGLDYACNVDKTKQEEIFRAQLSIAEKLQLPVVLHCVRAFNPTLLILKEYSLRGVIFHGFIGSREQAAEAVKRGYYLSFGEEILRSPKTIEALRHTPLENLFFETDVSTKPIEEIYNIAAQLMGKNIDILINSITDNYNRLFKL
jgi:TatD DNase family protein